MKKDNAIVAKPIVNDFLLGFMSSEKIDGRLAMIDDAKQKINNTFLEK